MFVIVGLVTMVKFVALSVFVNKGCLCTHFIPFFPFLGVDVRIEEFSPDIGSGSVMVQFLSKGGYLCSDGFDHEDAMVICRELNYRGGYSYK